MKYLILLILFSFVFTMGKSQNPKLEKRVSKYVEMEINLYESPGIIIGIIEGDSVYVYSFGDPSKDSLQIPTASSIFEIGSLTKVYTASLLQIMVDAGKIDYDKTLADYFGTENLHQSLHNITVWQLATHTSGLPRVPTNFSEKDEDPNNPFAHYTSEDLDIFLQDYFLLTTDKYLYSHTNYALIERIIEKVEHQPFQKVLQNQLLQPLGLKNTTYILSKEQQEKLAIGYLLNGDIAPTSIYNSFYGAVGLKASMDDLVAFVQHNLGVGTSNDSLQVSLRKIQQSQVNTGVKDYIDTGIGWHIIRPKRRYYNVISHRGTAVGHQAYIAFLPETKTGVIVLANSRNSLEGFGYFMLKMVNNNWKRRS